MAQSLLTKRKNVQKQHQKLIESSQLIFDWDSYLYSLWKQNMALNPGLFDDARLPHGWHCDCCSRTIFYVEEHKRK